MKMLLMGHLLHISTTKSCTDKVVDWGHHLCDHCYHYWQCRHRYL